MEKGTKIQVLDKGYVRYIDHMGDDKRIVETARVSYMTPSKGEEADKKLLEYLFKNRHTSPFEHVKITFEVKLPLFVARQWIRHRMQNINEVSARYTELPDEFYIPVEWRKQDTKNKQSSIAELDWNDTNFGTDSAGEPYSKNQALSLRLARTCQHLYLEYQQMLNIGVAREMARIVLPLNIYTLWYSTWDLHNLLHFIRLRDDAHAQAEIQEYSKAIKAVLKEVFPWTMEIYEKYELKLLPK